jgi:L-arabinonolactonase
MGRAIERVGEFTTGWGESALWDERSERWWFVDCLANAVHWLAGDDPTLHTIAAPSMPTGIVPTEDDRLVVALEDGLHVLDPSKESWSLLAAYPEGLGGRANDACADGAGNLITGTLNLGPAEGSLWWFSHTEGWRIVADDIANTNGPQVLDLDGTTTLLVGDSSADYWRYDYEPARGAVGPRSCFGAVGDLAGVADGTALDDRGGLWCALFGGSQLVRFSVGGFDEALALDVLNPTDLAFGGPDLDVAYVTTASFGADEHEGRLDGALLRIEGLGRGRPEPRFDLG